MVNILGDRARHSSPAPSLPPQTVERVKQHLSETRRWCSARDSGLPLAARFRTPELAPDLEDESALPALEAELDVLAAKRRAALAGLEPSGPMATAADGRLLLCELDMSIGSGEAEAASQGFFDADDQPPWDLWLVCYGRTRSAQPEEPIACIVAWVPEALRPNADAGVRASSARCLHWVDQLPGALADQLRLEALAQ
jgi:hypothetical protein